METDTLPSSNVWNPTSTIRTVILVCLVAALCYIAPTIEGALMLNPRTVWPLWPGSALLVAMLLLVPRRLWLLVIPLGLAAFVLYDLQIGVPLRSIMCFIPADTVQVLIATLGLKYFFDRLPRLNSVDSLAKFLLCTVVLAPFAAAFLSAPGIGGNYWNAWKIAFFSEVLAFLTLTPAILNWVNDGRSWLRRSRVYHLEAAGLFIGLALLSYFCFAGSATSSSPALLYSLVPFLLWSALRFGSLGISSAVIVVAFLSIWGAVHGRGPFTGAGPFEKVFSLQLFLLFTAIPFMVLAAVVEERKQGAEELREGQAREHARAMEVETLLDTAPITILIATDAECKSITANRAGCQLHRVPVGANFSRSASPAEQLPFRIMRDGVEIPTEELPLQRAAATGSPVFGTFSTLVFEDGTERHMIGNTAPLFGEDGRPRGAVGAFVDITERQLAEDTLSTVNRKLIEAQEQERLHIARELHDDLSQRMALLQIGLEQFEQQTTGLSAKARLQLHKFGEVATEVSSKIHGLSHELHPSILDTLGLVVSLGGFCREFSGQHGLQVQYVCHDVPGQIPKDVALCLFRIVQEALRNAVKHSGAKGANVELSKQGDRIELCISDSGQGFDTASVNVAGGLGLTSMRERVRLIGGELAIESNPSHGTRIRVQVPLATTNTKGTSKEKARKAGA